MSVLSSQTSDPGGAADLDPGRGRRADPGRRDVDVHPGPGGAAADGGLRAGLRDPRHRPPAAPGDGGGLRGARRPGLQGAGPVGDRHLAPVLPAVPCGRQELPEGASV